VWVAVAAIGAGGYFRAVRTSSAVGVSPNHFWSTSGARAWAWSPGRPLGHVHHFLEQGYAATSVDEIAERADVARRTLFNHFLRKQDLLAAWAGECRDRRSEMLAEDSAHDQTAAAMLRHQFLTLADMNKSDAPLATILVQGWLAEISDLTEVFPIFISFRDSVMLGSRPVSSPNRSARKPLVKC
jgi:tetracycline repressor-like protein